MKKSIFFTLCALFLGSILCAPPANAQLVTGMAYIENGNVVKAKEAARREAMRSFVEQQVGVSVNAESETENFLLVRDHIVAKSEGFVIVKKVVKESSDGVYFTVVLDLEAGAKPIEAAQMDVKTMLGALDRNSSRGSLDIAITDENADATWDWSSYMVAALKGQGFGRIKRNDAVLNFLGTGNNLRMNKLQLYPELRRIGRTEGTGAKAIVRGSIRLARPAQLANNAYVATAQASVEIIGYDSNNVDAMTRYATAVGMTADEAEANAKTLALEETAKGLAEQAAVTVQYEEQGGKREIETIFVFQNLYDKVGDSETILAALKSANCEVDRSVFDAGNSFSVAIYTQEYNKLQEVIAAVLQQLRRNYPGAVNEDSGGIGATKTIIRLR